MTLSATFRPGFKWLFTQAADLDTRESRLNAAAEIILANGTGNDQGNSVYSDSLQLAASANADIDLSGSLLNPFGTTILFTKIKGIYVFAKRTNTNSVIIKPAAANSFLGPFGAATHTITLLPGAYIELVHPLAGWTVTPGTDDKLNFANSAAGTVVDYDVEIVGVV